MSDPHFDVDNALSIVIMLVSRFSKIGENVPSLLFVKIGF